MNIRSFKSAAARRQALESQLGITLTSISNFSFDEDIASTKNCENLFGATQIPLGVAGPLTVNKKDYFVPLATTEGALVASVSRGIKAIREAGGAVAISHRVGMTRGPVFYTGGIKKSNELYHFIKKNEEKLKDISEKTSHHLKLKKITVKTSGIYAFVRFYFDTQDAMGMNMATIATTAVSQYIEGKTGVKLLAVAGNFDIDKKPAWLNFISNRGIKAWAEVVLSEKIVKDVLKTTPEKFFETWLAKCMVGSAMSGSLGFNAQFANIAAALFIATGQDPAHVVEASMGITTAKILENRDLLVTVYLPALEIGTVGGGTQLATQKEALTLLGVKGEGQTEHFAEIIAASVLAGELSLLASLSENTLACAHERLGRGKIT